MLKIFKYSFYDLFRSYWTVMYFLFFLIVTFSLLSFSANLSKGIASLMNVSIAIIPLISIVFGVMYYYNSREFIDLLLSQPIKRTYVFMGQYLGLTCSLSLSYILGLVIPFLSYGLMVSSEIWDFSLLVLVGILLTFIFVSLSYFISMLNENKIKGFGISILIWLYLAIVYDGLVLLIFVSFNEYPLEKAAIILTLLNPIDLSRILILLKLDISALMGYTGAVFNNFFGTFTGMLVSFSFMLFWIFLFVWSIYKISQKRDF